MKALLALALIGGVAHAQPSPLSPADALAKVEATYKKPAQLTASFVQANDYAATGASTSNGGTLWISKPDKIRFDYTAKDPKRRPLDKQYFYDGTTVYQVDHKNTKINKTAAGDSNLPALLKFFTGAGSLTSEFTVAAPADKTKLVPGAVVLQLTPKKPNASYAQLYLVVDPTAWTVAKTTSVNSSGDTTTFTFSKIDMTTTHPASWFAVDPKTTKGYGVETLGTKP